MITPREFVKKYTAFSVDFIDEYYAFLEKSDGASQPYSIPLTDVAIWLKVSIASLIKEMKRAGFTEGFDYKTLRGSIYIDSDTFRYLAIESRSAKGAEVRRYHQAIEKMSMHYRNELDDTLMSELMALLAKQKKKIPRMRPGELYIGSVSAEAPKARRSPGKK